MNFAPEARCSSPTSRTKGSASPSPGRSTSSDEVTLPVNLARRRDPRRVLRSLAIMYVPGFAAVDDDRAREHRRDGTQRMAGDRQRRRTAGGDPDADPVGRGDRLVAHMAKANPHWRAITDGMQALVIVTGPEAYISPSWYASKAEHGRVVPTWNYLAVHLTGTVSVPSRPRPGFSTAVTDLTNRHEHDRVEPVARHRCTRRVHHRTTPSDHRHRDARRTRRGQGEAQPEPLRRRSTRSRRRTRTGSAHSTTRQLPTPCDGARRRHCDERTVHPSVRWLTGGPSLGVSMSERSTPRSVGSSRCQRTARPGGRQQRRRVDRDG